MERPNELVEVLRVETPDELSEEMQDAIQRIAERKYKEYRAIDAFDPRTDAKSYVKMPGGGYLIRRYTYHTTIAGPTKKQLEADIPYRYYLFWPASEGQRARLEKLTNEEAENRLFTEFMLGKVPSNFASVKVTEIQE